MIKMTPKSYCFWFLIFLFNNLPREGIGLVVPEDVPTGFAAIFGFAPKLVKGNDHRFGFGFRFGNQADFQILYEIGPQISTKPLQTSRLRSTKQRGTVGKRRPFLDLLLRAGFLKPASHKFNAVDNNNHGIQNVD